MFTGDGPGGSGDFLMRAMHAAGYASIPTSRSPGDGLELRDAYILAAVRCAPPDNKPTPAEIANCRRHVVAEMGALPRVAVVLALGKIAFDTYLAHLAAEGRSVRPRPAFGHGVVYRLGADTPVLVGSYHPSRQNTNTGRLTPPMLESVFRTARALTSAPGV